MKLFKIIDGRRVQLEQELVNALFTGDIEAVDLHFKTDPGFASKIDPSDWPDYGLGFFSSLLVLLLLCR